MKNQEPIILNLEALENELSEYRILTDRLSGADIEEKDEVDVIIADRNAVLDRIKKIVPVIEDYIAGEDTETAELINKMLKGEAVMRKFSPDEKALKTAIQGVKSKQSEIIELDKNIDIRFKNKYNEIKDSLTDLQIEKKKIDFYNNARIDTKGSSFNLKG